MNGCIYRTKDGECDLYSEGGKFKAWCDIEHCDNIAPTNADRIRAMSDEELAEQIAKCVEADFFRANVIGIKPNREEDWLEWLKGEVKE